LLFLLDELAEANRGAFDLLLRTDIASLTGTAASSPQDVQLALQLQRGYAQWTREHGLDDVKSLDAHYDGVRLSILSTIVETSPTTVPPTRGSGRAAAVGPLDTVYAVALWRHGPDERTTYAIVRAEIGRALHRTAAWT
jgi:hypothetical protein